MGSEKKYSWTKEGVFEGMGSYEECVVEAIDGVGASVVVSIYAMDDTPISITMNGEEVMADVVLFTLEQDEFTGSETIL